MTVQNTSKSDWMVAAGLLTLFAVLLFGVFAVRHQEPAKDGPGCQCKDIPDACCCVPGKGCECEPPRPFDDAPMHKRIDDLADVVAKTPKPFVPKLPPDLTRRVELLEVELATARQEIAAEREWRKSVDLLRKAPDGIYWAVQWDEKK